jgi:hypothetical protein
MLNVLDDVLCLGLPGRQRSSCRGRNLDRANPRLVTAIVYLNQRVHFDPTQLRIPKLGLAALWVFGSLSEDQSECGLWGDLTNKPVGTPFAYPA